MTTALRPPPMFIADAAGIDLLNTVATVSGGEVDWLGNGADLLAWLEQARLLPANVALSLRTDAPPGRLDAVAAQARALREWFRAFVIAHKGAPTGREALVDLEPLNRLLARDEAYGVIVASEPVASAIEAPPGRRSGSGLHWRWERRWATPDALLLPIAQSMADVVCDGGLAEVKQCEGPGCTLLFRDTTKSHARRWCSMAICGNRAKQTAHRERMRRAAKT